MTELIRVRPLLDLDRPALSRIRDLDRRYRQSANGCIPSVQDLNLPENYLARLLHGVFLGEEPMSYQARHVGSDLRFSPSTYPRRGGVLGDLKPGPYLNTIAREYADVRAMGTARLRDIYVEVDGMILRYFGGIWPLSEDGKKIDSIISLSVPIFISPIKAASRAAHAVNSDR